MKVLIASRWFSSRASQLQTMIPDDVQILVPQKGTEEELIQLAPDAEIIVCVTLSHEVAQAARRLKLVQKTGAGVDGIPFDVLRARADVYVANTSGANPVPMAEGAVALVLALAKQIVRRHTLFSQEDARALRGVMLRGKNAGIVGLGHIGIEVARLLKAFEMKILALDIGAGTEDVLIYDDAKKSVENCLKMILPSPSQVYASQVRAATRLCQDLFINGDIIGGGVLTSALKKHIKAGLRVTMTEHAAYTVRNILDEVRELGIKITSKDPPINFHGKTLTLEEVNLTKLKTFLVDFNEPLSDIDVVAVAVQDHGVFPLGTSNRRFRIQKMKRLLDRDPRPEALIFREDEVPACFLRMKSAVQASKRQLPTAKVVVMDTAPAAILGCLEDPTIKGATKVLAINVGNGHTMAALIEDNRIVGVLEHHTQLLNSQKIEQLLVAFADGRLSDEEVFRDNGHGVFLINEPLEFPKIEKIAATGPNRNLLTKTNLPIHFAAPAGDVMMTGPMGLVEATRRILSSL